MSYVGYILAAILLLLLMITVHEFGHYIAGKIFGFGIEEFAIGFGPKLYRKQRKNGEYFRPASAARGILRLQGGG